ncbi:uncharacterized protein FA14DRAFT_144324 [Meira miltonrushii]|uniref:AP complex mu/sigma subunit domain-containing protein n=1 Tax=Meira miltonrushii TaxID=1280837 RepID=A0A316VBK0_9BASI|nr:uncharacterized protein FA14DRAFT_144324 [Meira miltonrushii]PWN34850.1 hypothetical protein FA14DRAFT_144324 [Meira miltonrushii]
MAIRAALIFNNHGKPRLTRFYSQLPTSRQQALLQKTFALVHKRTTSASSSSSGREACNFLDAPELRPLLPPPATRIENELTRDVGKYEDDIDIRTSTKPTRRQDDQLRVIYRHYATLYFVFIVDESESELGILDLIQVFVEALDRSFENVCELDLIFHFDEVHGILDEIIQGGLVLETNISEIAQNAELANKARKASASTNSITGSAGVIPGMGGNAGVNASAWTPPAGLGGMPWGGAAAQVGGWARDWGARLGSGNTMTGGSTYGRIHH